MPMKEQCATVLRIAPRRLNIEEAETFGKNGQDLKKNSI